MDLEVNFRQNLDRLQLKSFMNLKMSRDPSECSLKVGCALVAIFFNEFEEKHLPNDRFETNEGVNIDLYNFYFSQPIKMYRVIQSSPELISENTILIENIRFAMIALQNVESSIKDHSDTIEEAIKNIFYFLISFIRFYLYSHESISSEQKAICNSFLYSVI